MAGRVLASPPALGSGKGSVFQSSPAAWELECAGLLAKVLACAFRDANSDVASYKRCCSSSRIDTRFNPTPHLNTVYSVIMIHLNIATTMPYSLQSLWGSKSTPSKRGGVAFFSPVGPEAEFFWGGVLSSVLAEPKPVQKELFVCLTTPPPCPPVCVCVCVSVSVKISKRAPSLKHTFMLSP